MEKLTGESAGGLSPRIEDMLDRILDTVADPVFVKDRSHRWIYVNEACCRLVGRRREELLGKSDYDYFPKEQADVFWAKDDAVFDTGRDSVNEEEITDAGGLVHTIVTKKSLFLDGSGRKVLVGVVRDTTERKRVEDELRRQNRTLSAILESMGDGVVVVDESMRFLLFNESARRILGRGPTSLPPERWTEHYGGFRGDGVTPVPLEENPLRLALQGRDVDGEEYCVRNPELRDPVYISLTARAIRSDLGRPLGAVAVFQDVTERKEAEWALRESERRFQLFVESVRDYAIFRLDPEGRVATWSPGAARIKGYKATEVIGRHLSTFYTPEDREGGKPRLMLDLAARTGRAEDEGWRVRKDGTRFWASVLLTALVDEEGRLVGFFKITRDISDRREAEEALRRKSEELARSNAELEVYASAASHDLVDPLNTIRALSELLGKRAGAALDPTSRDILRRIHGSAERMASLVSELLAFSKVREQRGPMQAVDLNAVLVEVLADLEHRISECGARVESDPLPTVSARPLLMRQLLQNLLGNALKFHKKGEPPQVRLSARPLGDGRVAVSVSDDGIGFDPRHAERIFSPFIRLHARSEYEGHGLGLALCRRIAVQHGGSISASGRPGGGSVFTVTLPLAGVP